MKIKVTRTYQFTTIHEIKGITEDNILLSKIGLACEYNTHAAVDALRHMKSDKFEVDYYGTGGMSKEGQKIEFIFS